MGGGLVDEVGLLSSTCLHDGHCAIAVNLTLAT